MKETGSITISIFAAIVAVLNGLGMIPVNALLMLLYVGSKTAKLLFANDTRDLLRLAQSLMLSH